MSKTKLIGPFRQLLTMHDLPGKGRIADNQLEILNDAGVMVRDGIIVQLGDFAGLKNKAIVENAEIEELSGAYAAMPGLIDAHTHICYAGSRAGDYAMRLSGKSYLEIAEQGGGIWSTVTQTRNASDEELLFNTKQRAEVMLRDGITTAEVKSGYALTVEGEIRMLEVIRKLDKILAIDLIPTCLAAHMKPKDFRGTSGQYLEHLVRDLLPILKERNLTERIDIFIENTAFTFEEGQFYLRKAKEMGFDITVHADQFTVGGSGLSCELGAVSADHLEASTDSEIIKLAQSNTVAVCLPGASLGLGLSFAPARKILNAGASLAIASDWNPGSAPMGDLLVQACVLGTYEHLSLAETLAAITVRAATALNLSDRGMLCKEMLADIIAFPTGDYREILYRQGKFKPEFVWKRGIRMNS